LFTFIKYIHIYKVNTRLLKYTHISYKHSMYSYVHVCTRIWNRVLVYGTVYSYMEPCARIYSSTTRKLLHAWYNLYTFERQKSTKLEKLLLTKRLFGSFCKYSLKSSFQTWIPDFTRCPYPVLPIATSRPEFISGERTEL